MKKNLNTHTNTKFINYFQMFQKNVIGRAL